VIFKLVDTAGIREATDQIEAIGIERTMKKIQDSAILIYVVDVSTASKSEVEEDLAKLHSQNMNTILLLNKWDVNTAINPQDFQNQFVSSNDIIPCSAKENINIDLIKNKLISTVTKDQKLTDRTIISNARHYESLHHAAESLESVIQGIDQNIKTDFLAQHIRHALFHLGVISGEITNDEILGNIFSKFCIGK
jgi:tRNA modification GTPase